jgi:hypothetical protein
VGQHGQNAAHGAGRLQIQAGKPPMGHWAANQNGEHLPGQGNIIQKLAVSAQQAIIFPPPNGLTQTEFHWHSPRLTGPRLVCRSSRSSFGVRSPPCLR